MSVRDAVARRLHRWADRISDDEAMHHIGYTVTIEPGEGLVLHNTHGQISPEPEGCAIWVFGKDQPRMDPQGGRASAQSAGPRRRTSDGSVTRV